MTTCPTCGRDGYPGEVPPEPPVGTWVRDCYGSVSTRLRNHNGDGWCPGPGYYPAAKWEAMWNARGPLIECGPYGRDQ